MQAAAAVDNSAGQSQQGMLIDVGLVVFDPGIPAG